MDRVTTGSVALDGILKGGFPEGRTVLLTGTPGTGKTTLSMQYLQAGLDDGLSLFISTEQTEEELRDSFEPFDFDLDHQNLAVTTIHAAHGDEEGDVRMQTLGEGPLSDKSVAFTTDNIQEYIRSGASDGIDRVVLDSVSGLRPISEDDDQFRRVVLDLVRLFNDEIDATTVFTAEYTGGGLAEDGVETLDEQGAIQFNVHGVVRLWREQVDGDYHRFLDVMKMRGIDHDTRQFAAEFNDGGLDIVPRQRDRAGSFTEYERMATGIPGFDEFTGGGFVRGAGALLEHDGLAETSAILASVMGRALAEGMSLTLLPTVEMNPPELDGMLSAAGHDSLELLDDDLLFILDPAGVWYDHRNVFRLNEEGVGPRDVLMTIEERHAGDGQFMALNTEAKVQLLGDDGARELRYWQEGNTIDPQDVVLDMHNPGVMSEELAEFHAGAAKQVVTTWLDDSGLQYLELRKSPSGPVGSSRVVEYLDQPPYLRVRS